MGKATGVFLILAGVGTAALVLPAVDKDAERQLAEVVRIATGGATSNAAADKVATPAADITKASDSQPAPRLRAIATATTPRSAGGDQDVATAPGRPTASASQAKIDLSSPPVLIAPPVPVTKNATAAPARTDDAQARQALARDIQRELKRVGCYDGELSGEWNTNTRRAMKTFIDRVNAALPSEEPDHILRTMVQGHPGNACGRTLPNAIVAQNAAPKAVTKPVERTTEAAPPVIARDIATARPTVPKPAWETTVAAVPVAPLKTEGRMAIGGPIPPVAAATAAEPVTSADPRIVPREQATAGVVMPSAVRVGIVPGAIAALSQPPVAGQAVGSPDAPAAAVTGVRAAARSAEEQDAARRERQRQAARRTAPEPFKFPTASYLGAPVPKYFASPGVTERSSFTARFYARQRSEGSGR